ncbi:MAG: methyl-accepting chemotaxis protein [Bacteroides sp.]|nr:methyl-accepting chemotaxis protein [Prevotella sp.]MCM1407714.1 methyl-accepting chemotaxis protein [Treponema brennaborense]MCM1469136.1 methyl-accepting chemotaxis protein [Bacteroides sp.]
MQTSGQERKIPAFIFVLNWGIFIAPALVWILLMCFSEMLPASGGVRMFISIPSFLHIALTCILPFTMGKIFAAKISAYDGSEESVKSCNEAALAYSKLSIFLGIILNSSASAVVYLASGIPFQAVELAISMLLAFASIGLFGLFFYIFYLQQFERHLSFLPFREEFKSMSLRRRTLLVAFFAISGAVLTIVCTFIGAEHGHAGSASEIVVKKIIPIIICDLAIVLTDFAALMTGIIKRFKYIEDFIREIMHGNYAIDNLTIESRDEFGLLIGHLNQFADTTRTLLKQLQDNSNITREASAMLTKNMQETDTNVKRISSAIASTKNDISQQSRGISDARTSVTEIGSAISELNRNIETQASSVTQIRASIEQMTRNIENVTSVVNGNKAHVDDLSRASSDGQTKVEETVSMAEKIFSESEGMAEASLVIQNIAEQTNMLAMNAAIEAAHAGDAGKGFSVVADEIRKLSEDTNVQSRSITQRLKTLSDSIAVISQTAKSVQEQFNEIFALTQTVKTSEDMILSSMWEQNSGNTEILSAINQIHEITLSVKASSAQMLENSHSVMEEMDNLSQKAISISDSMENMNKNSTQIAGAVNIVANSVEQNTEAINQLSKAVNLFKL